MTESHSHHGSAYDGADRLGGALFWVAFGAIAAFVALIFSLFVDAIAFATFQIVLDVEACNEGFSDTTLAAIVGVAVLTSVAAGSTLWRMRTQVGAKVEPGNERWGAHLRRSFTISAIGIFVLASPGTWILVLGMASC
ncbi:MAG: hypothetical protein HZB14_09370 [Actinobacteria bacterium]|nr:hypothetical protein [Actinomycetota bacterium]